MAKIPFGQIRFPQAAALMLMVRSGEPVPDPIVALWKNDLVERLDLGPLDAYVTSIGPPVGGT